MDMRNASWLGAAALVALAACSGITSYGGGGGGGGGGGLPGHVTVGNIFFRSDDNGNQNPAVTTITAGSSVTWTWNAAGSHSIQSTGSPSFTSSGVLSANGATYTVTFDTPGTYTYDCGVHGTAMTGRVVVQ
jgi:plastocyanin